ncbi:MAG: hypothetical protein ABWW65_00210 [Thermoprotei archaeon]
MKMVLKVLAGIVLALLSLALAGFTFILYIFRQWVLVPGLAALVSDTAYKLRHTAG